MNLLSFLSAGVFLGPSSVAAFSASSSARVAFPGLASEALRHPLDRDITSTLQALPFQSIASEGIRRAFALVEQGLRLDLLSTSLKVTDKQLPEVYQSLLEACEILDLETPPELYVQSNSVANAYTLALRQGASKPPIIVVTSALLDRCTPEEIQAILGHELGHLKCEHSIYFTLGSLISVPLQLSPLLGSSTERLLKDWRLAAEYSCDRAALLVAQDATIVNRAMLKLVSGSDAASLDVDSFLSQEKEYNDLLEEANPLIRASIQRQTRTHPLPVKRVAAIADWASSEEYRRILQKGQPLSGVA